tara:strand:- start:340 stop:705 length:366 start_codon:yes stop_codon:yes gene_type:complete
MKNTIFALITLLLIASCASAPVPQFTTPAGTKIYAEITPTLSNEDQIMLNVYRYHEILSMKNDQSLESAIKEGIIYAEEHCEQFNKKAFLVMRNDETPKVYQGHSGGIYRSDLIFDCKSKL